MITWHDTAVVLLVPVLVLILPLVPGALGAISFAFARRLTCSLPDGTCFNSISPSTSPMPSVASCNPALLHARHGLSECSHHPSLHPSWLPVSDAYSGGRWMRLASGPWCVYSCVGGSKITRCTSYRRQPPFACHLLMPCSRCFLPNRDGCLLTLTVLRLITPLWARTGLAWSARVAESSSPWHPNLCSERGGSREQRRAPSKTWRCSSSSSPSSLVFCPGPALPRCSGRPPASPNASSSARSARGGYRPSDETIGSTRVRQRAVRWASR